MERPRIEYFDPKHETMSKEDLLDLSFDLFRLEVRKAYERNAFYRKRFDDAGVKPDEIRTRDDIRRLPVTSKEDLMYDMNAHPPFGRRLQVPRDQIAMIVETSGTTGKGQELHPLTANDADRIYTAEAFGFFWAGTRKGTFVMQTLPVTLAGAAVWWNGAVVNKIGGCIFNIGNYEANEKLLAMKRYKPEILFATPSYLRRLEYVADQIGIDLRGDIGLKSIMTAGEGAASEWVRQREEKWGAKLFEQYACTQRGITWTCEHGMLREDGERGVTHFLPHLSFIEVVDPESGRHVEPGQEGEVIITPLGSEASPIIRFATRDKGRYVDSSHCPCGRPFDGLESCSVGRYDDMIKIKAANIWQNAIDREVFAHPEVLEYKGEVCMGEGEKETAMILVEYRPGVSADEKRRVKDCIFAELKASVGLVFDIVEWNGDSIFEQHRKATQRKIRRWTDRRFETQSSTVLR